MNDIDTTSLPDSVPCDLVLLLARWRDRKAELDAEWEECSKRRDMRGMSQCACELMQVKQCHDELAELVLDWIPSRPVRLSTKTTDSYAN